MVAVRGAASATVAFTLIGYVPAATVGSMFRLTLQEPRSAGIVRDSTGYEKPAGNTGMLYSTGPRKVLSRSTTTAICA